MEIPKVSVIIPVFNTEPFLKTAMFSILNQTLHEIELIIVDDGSTDNSLTILKDLAQTDARISIFSQPNSGQSIARNTALKHATGEYVYFMDSDDILDVKALEICYKEAKEKDLDIVTFDAVAFCENPSVKLRGYNYSRSGKIDEGVHSGIEMLELFLSDNLYKAAPWLLFVKRDFLVNLNLEFYPGIIHEDELFTPILYLNANRVLFIPKILFHRRVRENSTMTKGFSHKNLKGYYTVIDELQKWSSYKSKRITEIIDQLIFGFVNAVAYQSERFSFKERYAVFYYLLRKSLLHQVKYKNITILIFPFTITVKSFIRKVFS